LSTYESLKEYAKSIEGNLEDKGYAFNYSKQDAMEEMEQGRKYMLLDITDVSEEEKFTKLLPIARAVFGYSKKDLARRLSVSDSTVTSWENGSCNPSDMHHFRLVSFLTGTGVKPLDK